VNVNSFLASLLDCQEVKDESKEMKALLEERTKVEQLIQRTYASSAPTIQYGGSLAKDTMILESYDLDLPTYFGTDQRVGDSLEDLFNGLASCLSTEYYVERKRSALRLRKKGDQEEHEDFRIDVVPGRFTDETKTDAFLYVNDLSDKERLKTNLQIHITHVKNSGLVREISLLKLWKVRNKISVKTFILELLVIKVLSDGRYNNGLERNIKYLWTFMRDNIDNLIVEDPANPTGNDLSKILTAGIKADLKAAAKSALKKTENDIGWYTVFNEKTPNSSNLASAAYVSPNIIKPKLYASEKLWSKF
jgi:hypothetical protein